MLKMMTTRWIRWMRMSLRACSTSATKPAKSMAWTRNQVWPLQLNFFPLAFLKEKNHRLALGWRLIKTLLSSFVPPSDSLVSVSDLWRSLNLCLINVSSWTLEILGHHQVCHAKCEGPRTPPNTADANLDCAFVENAIFFTLIHDFEKPTAD